MGSPDQTLTYNPPKIWHGTKIGLPKPSTFSSYASFQEGYPPQRERSVIFVAIRIHYISLSNNKSQAQSEQQRWPSQSKFPKMWYLQDILILFLLWICRCLVIIFGGKLWVWFSKNMVGLWFHIPSSYDSGGIKQSWQIAMVRGAMELQDVSTGAMHLRGLRSCTTMLYAEWWFLCIHCKQVKQTHGASFAKTHQCYYYVIGHSCVHQSSTVPRFKLYN